MREPDEKPVPWGWLTALGLPLAHLAIQVALALGLGSVLAVAMLANTDFSIERVQAAATSGVFLGAVGTLGGMASLVLIYLVVTGLRKRPFRATIAWMDSQRVLPAAIGAVLLGGVMDAVTLAAGKPVVPAALRPAFAGPASVAAMVLFAVVITPLVEELLFRGILYPVAARSLGLVGGIAVTSALFGLLHVVTYGLEAYLIAQTLAAGLYLTWLRARTGSLAPSVAAHATLNLYATLEAIMIVNVFK